MDKELERMFVEAAGMNKAESLVGKAMKNKNLKSIKKAILLLEELNEIFGNNDARKFELSVLRDIVDGKIDISDYVEEMNNEERYDRVCA